MILNDEHRCQLLYLSLDGASLCRTLAVCCCDETQSFDMAHAGHSWLTVWVTASVSLCGPWWFDSRGMCEGLPRLDRAHSQHICLMFRTSEIGKMWGRGMWRTNKIIHRRVCSPVMSLCSRVFVRRNSPEVSQSTQPFLHSYRSVRWRGCVAPFLEKNVRKDWGGYKVWRPRDESPSLGSQLRRSDAGLEFKNQRACVCRWLSGCVSFSQGLI